VGGSHRGDGGEERFLCGPEEKLKQWGTLTGKGMVAREVLPSLVRSKSHHLRFTVETKH
jgi:hypothetical protein